MKETEENTKKSTSERISELMPLLSKDQMRFVIALQDYPTKKEAAEAIGVKPNTAYSWDGLVDEVAGLMTLERIEAARQILHKSVIRAAGVKTAGLDSDNETVRQKVASEVLDRELGAVAQQQDINLKSDVITVEIIPRNDKG